MAMEDPFFEETLEEAKARLLAMLDKGMRCPCCGQYAKRYRRKLNSGMARSLIKIYRRGGLMGWVYIPEMLLRSSEEGKLAYWGLLEEANVVRPDGGHAGWWRVTQKGEDFILRGLRVPHRAIVYNAICRRLDDSKMVNINDCLGKKFDLDELMRS